MPEKIMTKNVRRPAEMREKRATRRAGPLREINRAARPTHTQESKWDSKRIYMLLKYRRNRISAARSDTGRIAICYANLCVVVMDCFGYCHDPEDMTGR